MPLDLQARSLGFLLGLGDLDHSHACMGYQNACVCVVCADRDSKPLPAPEPVKQPWDIKAA